MDIVDALEAREGTTCVVGAGGKKTTLYALADRLDRAVVTATVRIPIFDRHVEEVYVTDDPVAAIESADAFPIGVVPERERQDRYRGYDPAVVDEIGAAHDGPVLVKADGARTREFKAPDDDEPQLPASADTVVPIASAHVVGKPLTEEYVHRPEEVAALTGMDLGETVTEKTVATVLASPAAGLKDVPSVATAIPLINKVDDADLLATARRIGVGVKHRANVPRVVLARMTAAEPLVTTVD
ncbi:MAG: selenium cofactor biosynthesis protein YqeC [Haloferacaceae archaeon]